MLPSLARLSYWQPSTNHSKTSSLTLPSFPVLLAKSQNDHVKNPSRETATGPALPSTTDIMPVYVRAARK